MLGAFAVEGSIRIPFPGDVHYPEAGGIGEDALRELFASQRIALPEGFAGALQAALQPGTTVLLTDQPLQPNAGTGEMLSIEPTANEAAPRAGEP